MALPDSVNNLIIKIADEGLEGAIEYSDWDDLQEEDLELYEMLNQIAETKQSIEDHLKERYGITEMYEASEDLEWIEAV